MEKRFVKAYRKDGSTVLEGAISTMEECNGLIEWFMHYVDTACDSVHGIMFDGENFALHMEGKEVYSWVL